MRLDAIARHCSSIRPCTVQSVVLLALLSRTPFFLLLLARSTDSFSPERARVEWPSSRGSFLFLLSRVLCLLFAASCSILRRLVG